MININKYKNISGIYCIKNKNTKSKYIGQTKYVKSRILQHLNELRKNNHPNSILQKSWNKYGEESFEIYFILYIPIYKNLMDLLEILLILIFSSHKSKGGYNISWGGNTPNRNNKRSEESKVKQSLSMMGKQNTKGKKFGKETSEKHTQKSIGIKKSKKSSSNFVGVYWDNTFNRWVASIQVRNKRFCLGYYRTEISAALAYNRGAILHFGKGAKLNYVSDSEIDLNEKIEKITKKEILDSRSSRYKGVSLDNKTSTWRARIVKDGKRISLGYFNTEEEAAIKYNEAAIKYFGNSVEINVINKKEDF